MSKTISTLYRQLFKFRGNGKLDIKLIDGAQNVVINQTTVINSDRSQENSVEGATEVRLGGRLNKAIKSIK